MLNARTSHSVSSILCVNLSSLVFLISRRNWIVSVTVTVTDSPVSAMNSEFTVLALRKLTTNVDCLLLRWLNG